MHITLSKRQKFFLATLLLLLILVIVRSQFLAGLAWRLRVLAYGVASWVVTLLALHDEDFSGPEWLVLPILPVFLSISVILVYPLMPREVSQIFFWRLDTDSGLLLAYFLKAVYLLFFAVSFYAALLCANIFNVAAVKTIQLLRVASSVSFFLTLICSLLFFLVIYSLHFPSWLNFLAVLLVCLPLVLQSIWSLNLQPRLGRVLLIHTFLLCLLIAEFAWALSFWPLPLFVFSLFLTANLYAGLGTVQSYLGGRLNLVHSRELASVAIIFLLLSIVSSRWSG